MPGERARAVVLAALGDEPVSTSDLYDRVGYPALVQAGLVSYHAFRDTLTALVAEGRASSGTAEDGATVWRRVPGAGDETKPAPPGSTPNVTGQP